MDKRSLLYVVLRFYLPMALIGSALVAGLILAIGGFPQKPPPRCPCQPAEGEKTVLEFDGTCHRIELGIGRGANQEGVSK